MQIAGYTIETLKVGELKTNCYLFYGADKKALIVDPGDEVDFILNTLGQKDLDLKLILATHGHFDHVLGAGELKASTKAKVYLNSDDDFLVKKALKSAQRFLSSAPVFLPFKKDFDLKNLAKLAFGKTTFNLISLPGHTPGLTGLYSKDLGVIFCGDMIFEGGGVGRVDFVYSDSKAFQKSLETIFKLPSKTLVLPGHGEPFALSGWKNLDIEF